MVEYHRHSDAPDAGPGPLKTAIVGVGGAGSNVLDRITLDRTMDGALVCMHTDVRVLGHAMAPAKLQLGSELMRGVGAGGDPDLGREAALFSREEIRQALQGHQIIFICAGLGGGTGSGAAPVIAEIAKSTGALVLVVATMPFSFEGRRRVTQAEEALELLQKRADALILFENNRMGELILPKDGIQKAFSAADQLISQSLRAVSTMISTPGLVKLGLDDLTAALAASNGRCLFGFGEARGKDRGSEALKKALKSPLIDQGRLLHQAKNLLVHIAGGEGMTLVEVEGIMKQIGRNVPDHTQILFGVAVDDKLGDAVAVTLMSSLGVEQLQNYTPAARPAARLEPPAPPRNEPAPAAKAPAARPSSPPPLPVADETDDDLEDIEDSPAPAAAPARAAVTAGLEAPDLFAAAGTAVVEAKAAPAAKAEIPDEVTFEESEPEPEALSEPEPPPFQVASAPEVVAPTAETTSVPLPRETPREEAAPAPRAEEEAPRDDGRPRRGGVLSNVIGNTAKSETDMFQSGDEGRGRFKNTEPSLVEGEDLDVPTWMRLRKKLQR